VIDDRGPVLAAWARARIREALGGPSAIRPDVPWEAEYGATFVTLRRKGGELQGCVGSIQAVRSLIDDVGRNALAAFDDSRGVDLSLADIAALDVEVSILSPLQKIPHGSESEMLAAVHVGDGVVIEVRGKRGVFLPAVWERIPDHTAFMSALKRKASLPPTFWSDQVQLWTYTVEHYTEAGA
jgi:AmmeMemoRadiSam system protein A